MHHLTGVMPGISNRPTRQVDEREAAKQSGDPADDVMENRQQAKMFQVLVHKWISSGLGL
jgi:hypothetical protein